MREYECEYVVSVSDGIPGGESWATYRRRADGSLQRVKSPALPARETRQQAELDLRRLLYRRAPMTREHRQRRAARLAAKGQKALLQARDAQDRAVQRGLQAEAERLFREAWQELIMGVEEPMNPDRGWYPPGLNIPLLAVMVEANSTERRDVCWAYNNFRLCRRCGCTFHRPCEGGCWWVEWDLCSRCDQAKA